MSHSWARYVESRIKCCWVVDLLKTSCERKRAGDVPRGRAEVNNGEIRSLKEDHKNEDHLFAHVAPYVAPGDKGRSISSRARRPAETDGTANPPGLGALCMPLFVILLLVVTLIEPKSTWIASSFFQAAVFDLGAKSKMRGSEGPKLP